MVYSLHIGKTLKLIKLASYCKSFMSQVAHRAGTYLGPVFVVLSGWESLTPPGQNTNPLQVSSQQMLVLIYLPWKDGKLS